MRFSPDCSTCSTLYDLGINENIARSQKANLNYLICFKLYDFLFFFRMHYGFLGKDPVNTQDTCFRSCKIQDSIISPKAFGDSGHVITLKHPAPIIPTIPLRHHFGEPPLGSAAQESALYTKFQKRKWAPGVHKKHFGGPKLVNTGQEARELNSAYTLPSPYDLGQVTQLLGTSISSF